METTKNDCYYTDRYRQPLAIGDKVNAYIANRCIGRDLTIRALDNEFVVLVGKDIYSQLLKYPHNVVRTDSDFELDEGI